MLTSGRNRFVVTEFIALASDELILVIRAGRNDSLDVPKESLQTPAEAGVDESCYFLALTFGTLLSSQGADAHHRHPFE
jgi:hypothetical protein